MNKYFDAVIFDLDGVITDTAEYHFRAWKRLADEDGIPFKRQDNEKLRGVSRRKSLALLLDGREVTEEQAREMMARKNSYYQEMIKEVSPKNLLPGVSALLAELKGKDILVAIASASRNAHTVVNRLGMWDWIDILADGSSVNRPKPAPDLFLHAARDLGVPASRCLVVEDAASGIKAAQAAGMVAVGLGSVERVGTADLVFQNLDGVTYAHLSRAATWRISETTFDSQHQNQMETILNQGNGYLGTRGTFEEGFPGDIQATLVHGFWDDAPKAYTELANTPDWTAFDIRVNGQRFRVDQGVVSDYSRYLDLRTGVLFRRLRWNPPEGSQTVDLTFERVPCLDDPHVLIARMGITALDEPVVVNVRAMLDSRVENEGTLHLRPVAQHTDGERFDLLVQTRHTEKELAMSARLNVAGVKAELSEYDCPGCPGVQVNVGLSAGESVTIDKFVGIFTSRDVADPMEAARAKAKSAKDSGYQKLRSGNDRAWGEFWEMCDVVIEGDDEAQISLRHALFQLRVAAPTNDEYVSIGAKTLSGFGYHSHVFWDTEIFVLPFFSYTQPSLARNMLIYRWHTFPQARNKARAKGYRGALYPWESAETGEEVTPAWLPHFHDPKRLVRVWTGDIELHINADIAYALHQYWQVTGDEEFWKNVGIPIILETAMFWGERVESENGKYAIRDVIGPDEYHEHIDNNFYTNRMVQWHLDTALSSLEWLRNNAPDEAAVLTERLELTPEILALWRDIRDDLILLYDPRTGLFEQFEGFHQLEEVDWSLYQDRKSSMHEALGVEEINHYKVIKQADVIMLLCLLRGEYNREIWEANWNYYAPLTDHTYGSSLGPAMHAWAACEIGQPDVAYEHFIRAARADLKDVRGNVADGIHAASAGGLWQAAIFGFAGLRLTGDGPEVNPRLPDHWRRLKFNVNYYDQIHRFDIKN